MTLAAVHPSAEPVPCLRGLDPAEVMVHHDCDLVYLLHLDVPFVMGRYAFRHYTGTARRGNLVTRMREHRTGSRGSKFLRLARAAGITWHLARVWPVTDGLVFREERRIKNMGGASRSCPSCGIVPRSERQFHRAPDGRYTRPERTP